MKFIFPVVTLLVGLGAGYFFGTKAGMYKCLAIEAELAAKAGHAVGDMIHRRPKP